MAPQISLILMLYLITYYKLITPIEYIYSLH